MQTETIAAMASGLTDAGIGIIRISGEEAVAVADSVFRSPSGKKLQDCASHTVHYGTIVDGDEVIDEVMVVLLRAPHTYTREDCVEIDCHGGMYVMQRVLDTVVKYGARPAEPGEFTKRAFLSGRIDLSQAESVMDVISSRNEYSRRNSLRQLQGRLGTQIRQVRETILHETAYIESALDDPEHFSLEGYGNGLQEVLEDVMGKIRHLLDTADGGRMLTEGILTVILGKPNAGKSSLLNLLAKEERAIVTDVPGTTRDVLREQVSLDGIPLMLLDTAGIRDSEDRVEQIGVSRAQEAAEEADLLLYVADSSVPLDENDQKILDFIKGKPAIVLLNKSDLPAVTTQEEVRALTDEAILPFCAQTGEGLDALSDEIKRRFFSGEVSVNEEIYLTNARQKAALSDALSSLSLVRESLLSGLPEDFYTIDLMDAYQSLGTIIGEAVEDDLIEEIFGKFCMGK